jgi:hypothetical protein
MGVIRMIKMFAWGSKVMQELSDKRKEELGYLKKWYQLTLINVNIKWVIRLD